MEFKRYQLKEICSYTSIKIPVENVQKHQYISTDNMLPNRDGIAGESEIPNNGKVNSFQKGNILISNIRPYFKKIWFADKSGASSPDVLIFEAKNEKVSPEFLYYILSQDNFFDYVMKSSKGTKMPRGDKQAIMKYEAFVFSEKVQKKIVNILESLDKKIAINKELINTIEEISQTLFKHWFIDFEFPNEEGKPYKSSGGEMVESELGEIPKGWKVFPLYDLAEYINGTSFKKHELQNEKNDLPIIKIAELKSGFSGNTKYFIGEKDKKYYLKNGDILFSWSGNPETSIDTFFWTRGKGILNQHIFKVVSTKYPQQLIYILLKYFKPTFSRIASNKQTTGLGHVTVKDLKRLKVVLPLDSSPYVQLNHLGDLILNLNLENIKLQELRDTLLPKLLSGEIEIPDELEV